MVLDLQQDVLSLKKKVQRLESLSFQEEPHRQPCEVVELFNGYTKEQLKETIRFDQKISTACKTLLYKLFTSDYIQSHSITGRRGNTFREAKPMMDERCIKIIRVLLKQKFGDHLSDTVITEKIQNVQKALRQKFKTECLWCMGTLVALPTTLGGVPEQLSQKRQSWSAALQLIPHKEPTQANRALNTTQTFHCQTSACINRAGILPSLAGFLHIC